MSSQQNKINNYFEFTVFASHRAKEIFYGSDKKIQTNDGPIVSSIKELETGNFNYLDLKNSVVRAIKSYYNDEVNATNLEMNQSHLAELQEDSTVESQMQEIAKKNEGIIQNNIFGDQDITHED